MRRLLESVDALQSNTRNSSLAVIDIEADARRIWDAMQAGGVALIPLDVAYAVAAQTIEAVDRTYEVKGRSLSKPCGSLGNFTMMCELLDVDSRAREIAEAVVVDYNLAMSVVGPYHADHEYLAQIDPRCIARSTKDGTMDILLNAGRLHNAIADFAWEKKFPVLGSSANVSLTGSKFRLQDVEQTVRDAAAIEIDYGLVPLHNPEQISSTIIDLVTLDVHRFGVNYEVIQDILKRHFRIDLPEKPVARDQLIRGAARG
jgi:tRNA A37 threonylcarbamoyladenosine synthetase subunit TsaC/SUA5/YrdC